MCTPRGCYRPPMRMGGSNETVFRTHLAESPTRFTCAPFLCPHARCLADHIQQKGKLCSFSRQLAIQTSWALYKWCWLILTTADMYIMSPASFLEGLNSWPWNNWVILFVGPHFRRPDWGKVAVFQWFVYFMDQEGFIYCLVITIIKMFYSV